jgi:GNAT superfamily N-acetyltransferase
MTPEIRQERPDAPDVAPLIEELEAYLEPLYPAESRHGLSIERLLREDVPFFVIRMAGEAAGCCGVKIFDTEYGEIKRMYVRPSFRGLGLGTLMLNHVAAYARQHGVSVLRLETGIHQTEAIVLYKRWGFVQIPPFGDYRPDPLSMFFEKRIV